MPLGDNGNPHPCPKVCAPGAWQVQDANLGAVHSAHIAFGSMSIFRIDDRDLSWDRFGSELKRESVLDAVAEGYEKRWRALGHVDAWGKA